MAADINPIILEIHNPKTCHQDDLNVLPFTSFEDEENSWLFHKISTEMSAAEEQLGKNPNRRRR